MPGSLFMDLDARLDLTGSDDLLRSPDASPAGLARRREGPGPGPRVLVVDDQELVREVLVDLLRELGYDVVGEAGNGMEALKLAPIHRPHVVLMDVRMPVMDGIECTRRLRKEFPHIAVIVLSAYDDPSLRAAAETAGARDYILKGSHARAIQEALDEACRSAGAESAPPALRQSTLPAASDLPAAERS